MARNPLETKAETKAEIPVPRTPANDWLRAVGKSRDKESFIRLFEHFAPRVKSYLMKTGLSPELADELAQETMLTVWNKAADFDPSRAAAGTWIFTIARNKRVDFLRRASTRSEVALPEMPLLADESPGPGENLARLEDEERIAKALTHLPEEQAALIRKSFFEGKSHAVIAEETRLPLGTVKSRIRTALDKLRGALSEVIL